MRGFLYDLDGQELTAYLRKSRDENNRIVSIQFSDTLIRIDTIFNIQHKIANPFFKALVVQQYMYEELSGIQKLLFSTYHKNIFSLFAAFELTKAGLHGPAKASLRHAFEALMIAKLCSLTLNKNLLSRWIEGKHISLGRDVLRNIQVPDTEPFWKLWGILSDYTHATIHAQQVTLQAQHELKQIKLNLVLLQVLLECNYHLLNSHFATARLNHYVATYGDLDKSTMPTLRKQARLVFRETGADMSKESIRLIAAYKRRWLVQS